MRVFFAKTTSYDTADRNFQNLKDALVTAVSTDQAVPYIHIQSANGVCFRMDISDDGQPIFTKAGTKSSVTR